jgi:hypothetical protein
MPNPKRTILLVLLLAAAAAGAGAAWSRLDSGRSRADASRDDLSACRAKFAAIDSISAMTGAATADEATIDRRLARAAAAALSDQQLASTDVISSARAGDSNFTQTIVSLRLDAVTLKQLVGFLTELSAGDNAVRTTDIDLTPPQTARPAGAEAGDRWTADVTLVYLAFSPKTVSDR